MNHNLEATTPGLFGVASQILFLLLLLLLLLLQRCVAVAADSRSCVAIWSLGQPVNIGVFLDATYDIGRIEDVHFNPWFSSADPFVYHQTTFGRAFVMGRSDWEYVFNTFCFAVSTVRG